MKTLNYPLPTFISEPIRPLDASFDTRLMAQGKPGLPQRFGWRRRVFVVERILEMSAGYGACTHGGGERYVRKQFFRILTKDNLEITVYFQRTLGRGRFTRTRWWLFQVQEAAEVPV